MDDALSDLIRAVERIEEEHRARRRKKKRPQKPSGPRPSGPNANKGCGTGAGGFGAGNSCAKEDGIPNRPTSPVMRPVNAKADMAKAKAMKEKAAKKQAAKIAADKAKAEANRPMKEAKAAAKAKQKKIEKLRQAAAERKAAKGEREAAEKQAAAQAAAAKRAAMLQKIRIKKANEQIKIVEKPAGESFSGNVDPAVRKRASETQVDYIERKMQADLDSLDRRIDSISQRRSKEIERMEKEIVELDRIRSDKYLAESKANKSEYALEATVDGKLIDRRSPELKEMQEKVIAMRNELRQYRKDTAREIHDVLGEFTSAHGGGPSAVPTNPESYKIAGPRAQIKDTEWLKKTWSFLGKVVPKSMADRLVGVKVTLRARGGGSHNSSENEIVVGGQSNSTAVHEYGHAIESKSADTMRALDEEYRSRLAAFRDKHQNYGMVRHPDVRYYDGPELPSESGKRPTRAGYKTHTSLLGYSKRYSDFGYNDATRLKYGGNPRYLRGTEVFSTGIESMYDDPLDFWQRHRKHFRITAMILSGRL